MTAFIDGKRFAAERRADIARQVIQLKESHGLTPGLAVILLGEDPAMRNKACQALEADITSVPGGVGPMTIVCLLLNTQKPPAVSMAFQLPNFPGFPVTSHRRHLARILQNSSPLASIHSAD